MYDCKDASDFDKDGKRITNSNDFNYFRDFTFHSDMYKVNNKVTKESHPKDFKVPSNLKVRKITKNHPRVNLPVFRKDRNKQIKVFSVKSNEVKHKKLILVRRNFMKIWFNSVDCYQN